jgi:hypothetical protein
MTVPPAFSSLCAAAILRKARRNDHQQEYDKSGKKRHAFHGDLF